MLPIGSTAGLTAAQKNQLQCAQRDLAALQPNATSVAGASGGGDDFASLFAEAEGGEEDGSGTGEDDGGLLGGLDSFATLSPAALRNLYGTPVAGGGAAPMKHAASHHAATPTTSTTAAGGRPATQVGGVSGGGVTSAVGGPAGLAQVLGQLQPILSQVSALLGAPRTAMPAGTGAGTVAGGGPTTNAVAGANSLGTTPSLAASLADLVSVLKELTQAINSAVTAGTLRLGTSPAPGSTVAGGTAADGTPANGAQPAAPGALAPAAAAATPAAPAAAAPAAAAPAAPAEPAAASAAATTPDVTPIPGSATGLGSGTTTLPPVGNTTLVADEPAGTGEPTNDPVMPTLADGEGVGAVPPAPAD